MIKLVSVLCRQQASNLTEQNEKYTAEYSGEGSHPKPHRLSTLHELAPVSPEALRTHAAVLLPSLYLLAHPSVDARLHEAVVALDAELAVRRQHPPFSATANIHQQLLLTLTFYYKQKLSVKRVREQQSNQSGWMSSWYVKGIVDK